MTELKEKVGIEEGPHTYSSPFIPIPAYRVSATTGDFVLTAEKSGVASQAEGDGGLGFSSSYA